MVAFTHPPNSSLDTQRHHLDPYPSRDPIDLPSTTTIPIKIGFMGLCFTIWWWLMNISHPGLQLINEKILINGLLVVNDLPCHSPPPSSRWSPCSLPLSLLFLDSPTRSLLLWSVMVWGFGLFNGSKYIWVVVEFFFFFFFW